MQIWLRKLPVPGPRRPSRSHALGAFTALAMTAALALPATATATATARARARATGFTVQVHIANHTPIVNRRWPIELTVTKGAKKLSGTVRYQWLFDGAVVRTQPQQGAYRFSHGIYRDQLVFPAQSIGEPLTLRFLVKTRYGTEHADWKLRTKKSR